MRGLFPLEVADTIVLIIPSDNTHVPNVERALVRTLDGSFEQPKSVPVPFVRFNEHGLK